MKLVELNLKNFRCYEDITVTFESLTALVGKNDAGKSTILEALDAFFNDVALDSNDLRKGSDSKQLTIRCSFVTQDLPIVLDEECPTSLKDSYLLDERGLLTIEKAYEFGTADKPKAKEIRIHCLHPVGSEINDLLNLTNTALKKRAKDLGIPADAANLNENPSLRSAIWNSASEMRLEPTLLTAKVGISENILKKLLQSLPDFALFKSDRPSTDQDGEAQDPLMAAVKEALAERQTELNAIVDHVQAKVGAIAAATLEKLKEMDANLSNSLKADLIPPKWHGSFKATISGDNDIPMGKRGSGVRRLLLLNFFRAKTENLSESTAARQIIYAIEEPETSQHPKNQRMLMRALATLSETHQVIVTTHTPMLARILESSQLRFVTTSVQGGRVILNGNSPGTANEIAQTLGVLRDHNVRLILAVEGPNDVAFFMNLCRALRREDPNIPDIRKLEEDGYIVILGLGGSNLYNIVSTFEALNIPEIHFLDSDKLSAQDPTTRDKLDHVARVSQRERCSAIITSKRELENYLNWRAINQMLERSPYQFRLASQFDDFEDVPKMLERSLRAEVQTAWNEDTVKRKLATKAASCMTLEWLQEADPAEELIGLLRSIAAHTSEPGEAGVDPPTIPLTT